MSSLRVLQIIKGLDIGGVNGGAERFSIDLSEQLQSLGCDVDICAFYRMRTLAEEEWLQAVERKGLKVFFATEWKGPNKLNSYKEGLKILQNRLEEKHYSIVHSHFQQGTYLALYLKKKMKDLLVLRTAHNVSEWEEGFLGKVKEATSNYIYPRMLDVEVGVSKAITDQLTSRFPASSKKLKPITIFNAINLPNVESKDRENRESSGSFLIGTVGRLAKQKGYSYLIDAIPLVLEKHAETKWVFLGDGELRIELEEQAKRLGINKSVEFAGQVNNVFEQIQSFNLFVSASLWEGLPTVIIEAMAMGVPVIATDIAGTGELIQDGINGKLVPAGDSQALADGIIEMIENTALMNQFAETGKLSSQSFSIETIAKEYINLFENLLSGMPQNGK